MESYPEDLLAGVFPLVFAVNAVGEAAMNPIVAKSNRTDSANLAGQADALLPKSFPCKGRSDFDRFLDAMAGSLADDNDDGESEGQLEFSPFLPHETANNSNSRNVSLFRPDDHEVYESTDDDLLCNDDDYNANMMPGSVISRVGRKSGSNSIRLYAGFGLTRRSFGSGGGHAHSTTNTSYAKALQHGQGFFQRARIVAISSKHQFPPSKDPNGTDSLVDHLKHARTSTWKAKEIFNTRPVRGILPAGWLEKHVYALPSVVLVVAKVSGTNRADQSAQLLQILSGLHCSLVPKRMCKIHTVGLVDDDLDVSQAQQWSFEISRRIADFNADCNTPQESGPHQITLLRAGKDLRSGTDGFPTSTALKRLHRSVRDSSFIYYLGQTRRTKEKLAKLSEGVKKRTSGARHRVQPPKELLPLAIRYCFKIAMYYEFQLKFEKSLKFMAEAYRHMKIYYHHLIRLSTRGAGFSDEEDEGDYGDPGLDPKPAAGFSSVTGDTEDIEVSVAEEWCAGIPGPPGDMAHQCLAVANWLNFKLLQAGFGSHTEGGLLAADGQWRQHSRVFCARRFLGGHPVMTEDWYFWCHVSHQRLVMSQLVERHPPKALGDLGNEYDEVLFRCAPWRAYEAAVEALLKTGPAVQEALASSGGTIIPGKKEDNQAPFVGGLSKLGLAPVLHEQSMIDHRGRALELVLRAIALFEHEWGKEKLKDAEDQIPHRPWSRFGARLYYLAGGVLLGMKEYVEATTHLENAAKYAFGWRDLEGAIHRLLAECYQKAPTKWADYESCCQISSKVMNACFNAKMETTQLTHFLSKTDDMMMPALVEWDAEGRSGLDSRLPVSFAVTFPSRTHATAGDTVLTSVWLRSNLNYVVYLQSVSLLSMAGNIVAASSDFLPRVMLPSKELTFTIAISLPRNLDDIAVEENASERQVKNSFTKSARPRTAGITSAAGGRLVSEKAFLKNARNSNAQWSLSCLGGKPMRCDGIRLTLFLGDGQEQSASSLAATKPVELTIKKRTGKTAASVKRPTFEEDSYVAVSWYRPLQLSLPCGPRCLRVVGPNSDMEITNLSRSIFNGFAFEGTVNRVCFKLQAGEKEECKDIVCRVKCSSAMATGDVCNNNPSPNSSGASPIHQNKFPEDSPVHEKGPYVRTPVIVSCVASASAGQAIDIGFGIPFGWRPVEPGKEHEIRPKSPSLARGESTYVCFELFRPSGTRAGSFEEAGELEQVVPACQTSFEVSISYKQERHLGLKMEGLGEDRITEHVTQKLNDSVVWVPPIIVSYTCLRRSIFCGGRPPSNLIDEVKSGDTSLFTNVPIVDGERVSVEGTLHTNPKADGFACKVARVGLETTDVAACRLKVTSRESEELLYPGTLYEAADDDAASLLRGHSKVSFMCCVQAEMTSKMRSNTFSLGNVCVSWLPSRIDLPDEAKSSLGPDVETHGPLILSSPVTQLSKGPLCNIEKAPFKTGVQCRPSVPTAAVPFEVSYSITNESSSHQSLSIALGGKASTINDSKEQSVLLCGLLTGDLGLAPNETRQLSYTAVATKPGMTTLPCVGIRSTRFNSWVVNENKENDRTVCILP